MNNAAMPDRSQLLALLKDYATHPQYSGVALTDVNTESLFGGYPIHIAAILDRLDDMVILIKFGADINCKGEHGYTALHFYFNVS